MSLELSDHAVTLFEAEVHHTFQPMVQDFRQFVRVKNCQGAKTVQFPVIGKGLATERTNFHTPLPVMNLTHTPVTVSVKNFTASELTDIFLNAQVNFDERQELVKSITMALQRRLLQLVIDALVAPTITKTVAKNFSGANDNLNLPMVSRSANLLDNDGVDKEGRTFLCHTNGIHHFARETQVSSADYNTMQVLMKGGVDNFYGFKFLPVPNMDEGGLPIATNDRTNFAFHKNAVGLAINMEPKVTIDWSADYGAHRVTGYLSANAVVIDQTGVVEITTDESA